MLQYPLALAVFYCRNNLLETFKCIKAYAMYSKKQKIAGHTFERCIHTVHRLGCT